MYDVIVIGGGPAGLNAALLLGRSRRRVLVIDAGQPRNAAARQMHGFLSRDGIRPGDLLAEGRREAARYDVEVSDDVAVAAHCVPPSDEHPFPTGFEVLTRSGRKARGRKLLLATGVCDELPEIPGIRECYGVSVHHCPYCDGWEHRDQRLAAYGRSPEAAVGLGLALRTWSDRVIVLTDGERLDERHRKQLRHNGVRFAVQRISRLVADDRRLKAVEFEGAASVEIDALFFNTVQRPACDLPAMLGCAMRNTESATLTNTSPKQRTNVPGLFLAGDADGDVQFAIVAAAEGATAAVAINRELQDEDRR